MSTISINAAGEEQNTTVTVNGMLRDAQLLIWDASSEQWKPKAQEAITINGKPVQ